jgi:ferredoxin-NADP reductase
VTALQLLGYILAAFAAQLALAVAFAMRRRRRIGAAAPAFAPAAPPRDAAAWQGWRDFRVISRAPEDEAGSQCSFILAPVDGEPLPPFRPGQYLTVSLDIPAGAGSGPRRPVIRCYSLSDRPEPSAYRMTVKRAMPPADRPDLPRGIASGFLHDHVRKGDLLRVRAPAGRFCLDREASLPVVLIAGGVGITPLMSMLRWCAAEQPGRRIDLYYGVRHGGEHAFKETLKELAGSNPDIRLHVAYSRPAAGDRPGRDFDHAGRIDLDLLRRTLPSGRRQFYLCGPGPMMESLVAGLLAWGVHPADIHHEAFGPASIRGPDLPSAMPVPSGMAPLELQFRRSGRTLTWDGRDASLLELAERCGVAVEAGCRVGSCGSCETRLLAGTVRYASPPDHPVAPGCCLLCVAVPASPLVLEA